MPGTPCERFDGWSPSHGTAGGRNSGRDDDDDDDGGGGGGDSAARSQAILFIVDRRPLSVCMPASPPFSLFFSPPQTSDIFAVGSIATGS